MSKSRTKKSPKFDGLGLISHWCKYQYSEIIPEKNAQQHLMTDFGDVSKLIEYWPINDYNDLRSGKSRRQ